MALPGGGGPGGSPCGPDPGPGSNDTGPWWVNNTTYTIVHSGTRPGPSRGPAVVYAGFPTKAEAEAYACIWRKKQPGGKTEVFPPGAAQFPSIPNPLRGIEQFFAHLADGRMWASVGWIALGILLVAIGINLWLKLPQKLLGAAEAAAAKAVPA